MSSRNWFQKQSVKSKISIGFAAVLVLHISVAAFSHYGLTESDSKLRRLDALAQQTRNLADFQKDIDELGRRVLLFTHSGHESQALRAFDLIEKIQARLSTSDSLQMDESDTLQKDMVVYLDAHRVQFEAIVEDRNRRRDIVNNELFPAVDAVMNRILADIQSAEGMEKVVALEVEAFFLDAEVALLRYLHQPDSVYVRKVKSLLASARRVIEENYGVTPIGDVELSEHLDEFESGFLQMVQATRGYLHLVNVVMPGETAEFERAVVEYRERIGGESADLAEAMLAGSNTFKDSSNVFSFVTIILGMIAAAWIGKHIGPPLNAVTNAFDRIADGEDQQHLPGVEREDDIGRLARAAELFRSQIIESTARLEMAHHASMTGTWDWDIEEQSFHANKAFWVMLGEDLDAGDYAEAELLGRIHPDDIGQVIEAVEIAKTDSSFRYDLEMRVRCKNGTFKWIRTMGAVTDFDSSGCATRMIGQHLDIQDAKDAVEKANAASKAKSEFLANMSHEIRTPMTAILGYADLLDNDTSSGKKDQLGAVRTIQSSATHLLTIINTILDVSKIEAGQMTVEHIETNPTQIVEDVALVVRGGASEKGVEVRVQYNTQIPEHIQSDPTRLRQILLNLAGNAVKFTDAGSIEINIEYDPIEKLMRFSIVDTGIGLTREQLNKITIFDAFTQADESMTRKYGGTGLGLCIANSFATMLGGGIEVQSTLGEGSTFTALIGVECHSGVTMLEPKCIELNADSQKQDSKKKPAGIKPMALDGVHILLAEDSVDNQRLITHYLKRAGAQVKLCDNGLLAVETIENTPRAEWPDLVLMDMQMPELDGYSATKRLRDNGCTLPIIAITAHAMGSDRQKCLDAGCSDYLTKPIDKGLLIGLCHQWTSMSDDQWNLAA
jgi:signal transduction histidine kinase/ActR/RegA family two-component response regulator